MATLLPADFDLTRLEHSERRVCTSFLEGLDDTWTVVPNAPVLVDRQDSEIDLLLVSATQGVVAIEVKGGAIAIDGGTWLQNGRPMARTPTQQVVSAKHCLVRRMKRIGIDLDDLFMCHAVALPDVGSVPREGLGPDTPQEIVFAKADLEFPESKIGKLHIEHAPIPVDRLHRFLHGVPLSQIAVLTTRTAMRDELLADPPDGCPLVRWEDRSEETVLCETVHRAKGLERTGVILVDMSSEPDPTLLYVGVSRAVSSLTLVGPPGLAHAVGVPEGAHGNGRST